MKIGESQNQETMNTEMRKPASDLTIQMQIKLLIERKEQGLNKQINEDLNKEQVDTTGKYTNDRMGWRQD